ncbi:MAG: glycosyl hydrolase family 79 C-terminal domain-containing protein [Chthoniobacteraceae bacterium]
MNPHFFAPLRLCESLLLFACFSAGAISAEVTATIDASRSGRAIPKSFAGLSREWRKFPFPESGVTSEVHPVYLRLIEQLCAFNDEALSVRIGGATAEYALEVPAEPERWAQIARVFKTTRTPLVINIGLARGDVERVKKGIRLAHEALPPGAVASFELGNEPDGWPGKHKPADHTFEQYLDEFHAMGSQIVPALTPGLAGPSWARGAPPEILSTFVARQKGLLNLLTVHSYRFDPKSQPRVEKLLEDKATTDFVQRLRRGIEVAHAAGLKLRLDETGTAWSGGVPGFSDSFAAALFTLDVMFELASAGLDGVNFHNAGTNAYSPIKEDVDKTTGRTRSIAANSPYYGMLVFAEAVANEARLVPVEAGAGRVKFWATLDKAGVLRVVAINKDLADTANVTLRVPGAKATLKRLKAPAPGATSGITFGGRTYDGSADGNPVGALEEETLAISDGAFRFKVAPASAMLVTIPPDA